MILCQREPGCSRDFVLILRCWRLCYQHFAFCLGFWSRIVSFQIAPLVSDLERPWVLRKSRFVSSEQPFWWCDHFWSFRKQLARTYLTQCRIRVFASGKAYAVILWLWGTSLNWAVVSVFILMFSFRFVSAPLFRCRQRSSVWARGISTASNRNWVFGVYYTMLPVDARLEVSPFEQVALRDAWDWQWGVEKL